MRSDGHDTFWHRRSSTGAAASATASYWSRLRARELGADVELHYVSAPTHERFERIQRRSRETPAITRQMLEEWTEKFEAPTPDEQALFDSATMT